MAGKEIGISTTIATNPKPQTTWLTGQTGWLVALFPLGLTVLFASLLPRIAAGDPVALSWAWVPSLNVALSFYVDGLSLVFALLVSGIGTLIMLYAGSYLAGNPDLPRFYILINLFMLSMLGVVTADNILTLFIFWELTSITSYLLIGFKHEKEVSRASALQALLVTGGGGLALLAGLILLGMVGGSLEISTLLAGGETLAGDLANSGLYLPILILILLGAFTKSAQAPFHFWLPNAMAAPTPVSAYLHSATMVKAGVYLLARFTPILGGTPAWTVALTTVGGTTMILGAYLAWRQTDLKRILAYTTISALGTLVFLLGMGTETALKTAMVFLIVHSLYKGALFLTAGAVDHATGSRDISRLGKLGRAMPLTAGATGLAALSMAGLPPAFGFIGKELIYESALYAPSWAWLLTGVAVATNIFVVTAAGLVFLRPFFAQPVQTPGDAPLSGHEVPLAMWIGPLVLAGLGLGAGLSSAWVGEMVVGPAAGAVAGEGFKVKLSLWHGINAMLILSILTVIAGGILYWRTPRRMETAPGADQLARWTPSRAYAGLLTGLLRIARSQTLVLQSGYLRRYLAVIVLSAVGLVMGTLFATGSAAIPSGLMELRLYEVGVVALILAGAGLAVMTNNRLAAIAALGVVGFSMALLYVIFGAPDLAMTQFAVETLTVILFVSVLYRLPGFSRFTGQASRLRDALIALAAGGMMTALVLATLAVPTPSALTQFFAENSLAAAKGRNVVNVILVDFRGLDTLGEIVVLTVAALGVMALLGLRLGDDGASEDGANDEAEIKADTERVSANEAAQPEGA